MGYGSGFEGMPGRKMSENVTFYGSPFFVGKLVGAILKRTRGNRRERQEEFKVLIPDKTSYISFGLNHPRCWWGVREDVLGVDRNTVPNR